MKLGLRSSSGSSLPKDTSPSCSHLVWKVGVPLSSTLTGNGEKNKIKTIVCKNAVETVK